MRKDYVAPECVARNKLGLVQKSKTDIDRVFRKAIEGTKEE